MMIQKPKIGGRPTKYPLAAILRSKAMFLDGASYAEIAQACSMDKDWLKRHAHHKQWYRLRQSPEHRNAALDTLNKELAEFQQAVTTEAQSLTLDAMPMVRNAIERDSPRDFKDAAQGVKTMLEITKLASITADAAAQPGLGAGVNLFFFSGKAERVVRDVTPLVPEITAARIVDDPEF